MSTSFTLPPNYNLRPEIVKRFQMDKPSIIFTNGPTGSGKSSLLAKTLELIYKTQKPTFESFLIDDYVEQSETYKNKVKDIIRDFNCGQPSETCNLENPSQTLLSAFASAYFEVRNKGPCNKPPVTSLSCKDVYNDDLMNAIKQNKNILIETTGKKIPLDYLQKLLPLTNENYNVIFVYSIVNFEELMKRNKSRAKNQMKAFIDSNYADPAPRLPDISPEAFKQSTKDIEQTLVTLRNICLRQGRPPKETCGDINSNGNYVLLIFDNNAKVSDLIYDSRSNDKFMSDGEFISLLSKYSLSGGKRRRRTVRKRNVRRKTVRRRKYKNRNN